MKQFKAFFAAVVMMMTSQVVMAQTTVKGVLMDETLGEAEPFATVRVFKAGKKEKPVAMFLTKEDGQFSQEVKGKGKFDIVFSSVGKEDLRQTVTLGQENPLDLGTLYMKENATMLKGVEIVAQKPLVKMEVDKMSYNVAEDEDSKSNTVLDMLRKVPMVTVDGQDNITVNGSSSFKVYVDGMPNAMFSSNPSMVFKSMPATAVKSIEVMTNPGAKYDAEGAAGILNIIMNKQNPQAAQSLNGYNGTIRAQVGTKQLGASAFLNGQQGKLSYSANVMTSYNKPGTTTTEMEQLQDNGSSQILTSENDVKTPFTMEPHPRLPDRLCQHAQPHCTGEQYEHEEQRHLDHRHWRQWLWHRLQLRQHYRYEERPHFVQWKHRLPAFLQQGAHPVVRPHLPAELQPLHF